MKTTPLLLNIRRRVALAALLGVCGCGQDGPQPGTEPAPAVTPPSSHGAVLESLSRSGSWERTPRSVQITDVLAANTSVSIKALDDASALQAAERDMSWYASDGQRYEALFVLNDGTAYGRRGVASSTTAPSAPNGYVGSNQAFVEEEQLALTIGTDSSSDRRARISDTASLTSYPTRTSGSLSDDGNTQSGKCTGTKIGPRTVLTAAHCVMNRDTGVLTSSGFFNPGQTNASTPNGAIAWSGVFLRDFRIHRKFDYAVLYLADSQAVFNLGWMGVAWWTSAAGYSGRSSRNFGYPCGPNIACGATTSQTCKNSPRADKRCDGWMYSHNTTLDSGSSQSDDLLNFDNDVSVGHSGSGIFTFLGSEPAVMAVVSGGTVGLKAVGARFRQSMWDDVCSWIANPNFQSAFGSHSLCH